MNKADTKQATIFKQYLEEIEKVAKEGQARGGRASKSKSRNASAAGKPTAQGRSSGKAKAREENRPQDLRKAA